MTEARQQSKLLSAPRSHKDELLFCAEKRRIAG